MLVFVLRKRNRNKSHGQAPAPKSSSKEGELTVHDKCPSTSINNNPNNPPDIYNEINLPDDVYNVLHEKSDANQHEDYDHVSVMNHKTQEDPCDDDYSHLATGIKTKMTEQAFPDYDVLKNTSDDYDVSVSNSLPKDKVLSVTEYGTMASVKHLEDHDYQASGSSNVAKEVKLKMVENDDYDHISTSNIY